MGGAVTADIVRWLAPKHSVFRAGDGQSAGRQDERVRTASMGDLRPSAPFTRLNSRLRNKTDFLTHLAGKSAKTLARYSDVINLHSDYGNSWATMVYFPLTGESLAPSRASLPRN